MNLAVTPRITCLVGKKESGRTAGLEAIYRLKPSPRGHPEPPTGQFRAASAPMYGSALSPIDDDRPYDFLRSVSELVAVPGDGVKLSDPAAMVEQAETAEGAAAVARAAWLDLPAFSEGSAVWPAPSGYRYGGETLRLVGSKGCVC